MPRMSPKAPLVIALLFVAAVICACSPTRIDLSTVERLADATVPTPTPSPSNTSVFFPPPDNARYFHISDGVVRGMAMRKVQPNYPLEAQARGVTGIVRVQITIDTDGKVAKVKALSGPPLLREAALQAASQWKYKPTLIDTNVPIYVVGMLEFKFPPQ